ncbi:MAG: DoxX family protein [Bryobacterales bacterium]|nr:DoxX family protein [Bryobacterales bacterium]
MATILFCLMMTFSGTMSVLQVDAAFEAVRKLGYPDYLILLLGVWKLLGVVALLLNGFPLLKEWAYAGFTFDITGAAYSHLANGDGWVSAIAPLVFLGLLAASYFLRPESRRLH